MRKTKFAVALLLGLVAFAAISLVSSQAATITYTVEPAELAEAGFVNIVFKVTNDSDVPMTRISLSGAGRTYHLPNASIAPHETQDLMINDIYVEAEQLGSPIVFMLTWYENDEFKSDVIRVTVNKVQPTPTIPPDHELLQFSYSPDKRSVEKNDIVEFTYVITNISDVTVNGINLQDPEIAGNKMIVSNLSLAPGQEYVATYKFKMGETSVIASPVLTYIGLTGANRTIRGESIQIERVTVQMDISVTQGETKENGTEFVIRLTNNGNKAITGIVVKDNEGNTIAGKFDLGIAETKEVKHTVRPDFAGTISFEISGTLATGEEYSYKTDEYRLWKYVDPALIGILFKVELVEPLTENGHITLKFIAENTAQLTMTGLVIKDSNDYVIGSLKDLAQGESDSAIYTVYAGEADVLTFYLTANDPTGRPWEFSTQIMASEFAGVDATPAYTPDNPTLDVGSTVSGVLVGILRVLAILTGIAGVALIVLATLEKQEKIKLYRRRRQAKKRRSIKESGDNDIDD
ncbi:MAG TPA: hypothetical protein GXZ61_04765 [Clostridiales bacterium]|jgi:hypothetical protein|nr:hypothetical protein [Clostridiales bacterium]